MMAHPVNPSDLLTIGHSGTKKAITYGKLIRPKIHSFNYFQ